MIHDRPSYTLLQCNPNPEIIWSCIQERVATSESSVLVMDEENLISEGIRSKAGPRYSFTQSIATFEEQSKKASMVVFLFHLYPAAPCFMVSAPMIRIGGDSKLVGATDRTWELLEQSSYALRFFSRYLKKSHN